MPPQAPVFDDAKMQAFGDRLVRDTSAMLLGNLAYIGDQLGLFKILAQMGPATPEQLADTAACNARYIREWLSAMAAAGWLEYEATAGRFTLPPEHAPFLADEDHPMYLVVYDLFREFSQPTLKHRSLFCCLSSREQIPERLTALLALTHPDVPWLAPPLLMKALQEVRRPDEPPERLGKRDRQVG
jgi:Rv2258c-like winged HTH domain